MDSVVRVVTRCDICTDVGIIAAGTPLPAAPSADYSQWLLEMSLPLFGAPSHRLAVAPTAIRHGRKRLDTLDRVRCAHYDYRFARDVLGYGHVSTVTWLARGYRAEQRTLERWGFTLVALGVAS